MITKDEFLAKNKKVDDAIKVLKSEFVGIHKQIDSIMSIVRNWFLFPDIQARPIVVNIWGLSGTGKTQLVKRIGQLLDVDQDVMYFNFASISECTSWDIEQQIEETITNNNPNRIIVFDEFQYANTLSPDDGHEVDKKTALKPFWELMDSGTLVKKNDYYNISKLNTLLNYITKINAICEIKLKDGVWINADACFTGLDNYIISQYKRYFNFKLTKPSKNDDDDEDGPQNFVRSFMESNFFLNPSIFDVICSQYQRHFDMSKQDIDIYNMIKEMDSDEFIDFIYELSINSKKGYKLQFNESIIFVIGNLDEAYQISFDVNPDMSPDQFRQITDEMNVVDIKSALKKRFRNEQIARMGNTHIIYPSFSKKDFEDLIEMKIEEFKSDVKKITGYNIECDSTINDIVYKEGVFPTHGTRPIFSTITEIIKTPLPKIIYEINDNDLTNVKCIKYSFKIENESVNVSIIDTNDNIVKNFDVKVNIRVENLRSTAVNPEEQSITAVHESGHFVMYAKLFGEMPEKLMSRTVDNNNGGFLMEQHDKRKTKYSKNDYLKEIQVLLGGYVAEKIVFGYTEYTSGASGDLNKATLLASKMIRQFCMSDSLKSIHCVTTKSSSPMSGDPETLLVRDDSPEINHMIKSIMADAESKVFKALKSNDWYPMFKESVKYLSKHSSMPQDVMSEIYDKVSDSVKTDKRSDTFYQDCVARM